MATAESRSCKSERGGREKDVAAGAGRAAGPGAGRAAGPSASQTAADLLGFSTHRKHL